MTGQLFTVNSRKYDFSLRRSWTARLIELMNDHVLLEGVFEHEIRHADLGVIAEGTRSLETFFFDRWYNYFVFYEPSGGLRNYYINISMPPQVSEAAIDYVDLDIDIIVWPDRRVEVLDEKEFEENAKTYGYPAEIFNKVLELKLQIAADPSKFITPIRS